MDKANIRSPIVLTSLEILEWTRTCQKLIYLSSLHTVILGFRWLRLKNDLSPSAAKKQTLRDAELHSFSVDRKFTRLPNRRRLTVCMQDNGSEGTQKGARRVRCENRRPRRDDEQENHDFHRDGAVTLAFLRCAPGGPNILDTFHQGTECSDIRC